MSFIVRGVFLLECIATLFFIAALNEVTLADLLSDKLMTQQFRDSKILIRKIR